MARIGEQDLVVAHLHDGLADAEGRATIDRGRALYEAADAAAGDLGNLVESLVASDDDDEDFWSDHVLAAFEEANTAQAVILLRAVDITPVMRGHGLGAWAAAHSVALFDQGNSLVATYAAPLTARDAIPGNLENEKLTEVESALWAAEQQRLAAYWRTALGLTPHPNDPNVLFWFSAYRNEAMADTLRRFT
jgi:hypothetical protein